MKKFGIISILLLAITLAGCGSKTDPSTEEKPTNVISEPSNSQSTSNAYKLAKEKENFGMRVNDNMIPGHEYFAEFDCKTNSVHIVRTNFSSAVDGETTYDEYSTIISDELYLRLLYLDYVMADNIGPYGDYTFIVQDSIALCLGMLDGSYRSWEPEDGIDYANDDIPYLVVTEWLDKEIEEYKEYEKELEEKKNNSVINDSANYGEPLFEDNGKEVTIIGKTEDFDSNGYYELHYTRDNQILIITYYNKHDRNDCQEVTNIAITDTKAIEDSFDSISEYDKDEYGELISILAWKYSGDNDIYLDSHDSNYEAFKYMDKNKDGVITMAEYADSLYY